MLTKLSVRARTASSSRRFPVLLTQMLAVAAIASAAGMNDPPPAGAILDLNGLTVPHSSYVQYSVTFTAALSSTAITFAFREDPAFLSFEDASVVDNTTSSGNLLTDGDFSGGTAGSNVVPGWTYANIYGATASGVVETGSGCQAGGPATNCWFDGAVQAYDAISQTIGTTIGDSYTISFWLDDNGSLTTFSDLSTNGNTTGTGGNGIDVLAYAQAGLPAAGTPEPASVALMGIGLAGIGFVGLRRRRS